MVVAGATNNGLPGCGYNDNNLSNLLGSEKKL